jgi:predicted dehydrogenase
MLRAGILGGGHFGACHARAIASSQGVRLMAVCDENASLAQALAKDAPSFSCESPISRESINRTPY